MKQVVFSLHQDSCQFIVIVCHHVRLWSLFGQFNQIPNVFNGSKAFLPQLHICCSIKLRESSIQMTLKGFRVIQINGKGLVRVLCGRSQMLTKSFAQSSKFSFAIVLEAKTKGFISNNLYSCFLSVR